MTQYDFGAQLSKGENGERFLDSYFARRYWILAVPLDMQRKGIDRVYISKTSLVVQLVEYKTDWTAGQTNNLFVETTSVDTEGTPGWAYTCQADLLFYYIPPQHRLYVIRPEGLRAQLDNWRGHYPTKSAFNGRYTTSGLIVPLRDLIAISRIVPIKGQP